LPGASDAIAKVAHTIGGLSQVAQQQRELTTSQPATAPSCEAILAALERFMECVRYLNTRRSDGALLRLESEADVQDAIFLMLRAWVEDLVPENPTDRVASRYTIKDFLSQAAQAVIEAKFIRDKDHGRSISKELHDDIETYRTHPSCRHLIFFIYDPNSLIPDQAALRRAIEVERTYAGRPLTCYLVIRP